MTKADGRTTIHRKTWNSWRAMIYRCNGKKYWARDRYAGRGIQVCQRWIGSDGFKNFLSDMGTKPEGCSLDRIDNSKGYSPENCRWANQKTQVANSSKVLNAKVCADEVKSAAVSMSVIYKRLAKGWDKQKALRTPALSPGEQNKIRNLEIKMRRPRCLNCGELACRPRGKYCSKECYIQHRYYRRGGD